MVKKNGGGVKGGQYCFGDEVSMADVFLVPQISSCRRFKYDLSGMEVLEEIEGRLMKLEAFRNAAPEN